MYDDIEHLLRQLMKRFVKKSLIKEADSVAKLVKTIGVLIKRLMLALRLWRLSLYNNNNNNNSICIAP